ncbi:transglutaminase-like cysteine peptidase [Hwanghaeella grinnelliae]|nr:transglutaminase-like cysteine peptidase [Hwanghaeella grinnelliae]
MAAALSPRANHAFYGLIAVLAVAAMMLAPMLVLAPDASAAARTTAKWSVFGTKEVMSTKLAKFQKWTDTLKRYSGEEPEELQICKVTPTNQCHLARWRIFLKQILTRPKREQLDLVNAYLNKWLYVIDPVNYGVKDYWATPKQFMQRAGDCEDYAISKFMSLAHLGFPKDKMRVLVLQDLNLSTAHAVLLVELDGDVLMLDNQISTVISADRVKHYKPIYSINEDAWWLHRG